MAASTPSSTAPTVLLIHGGFADASGWSGVIERLQAAGVPVQAPVNPLRSVSGDAAYIGSVFAQTPGPVLAVAHSYGGAVITNAATQATNVVGLVYVAAFAPEQGESLMDIVGRSKDSTLGPAVRQATYPTGQGAETAVELTIDPGSFHEVFCGDLPAKQAAVMAVSQRPFAAAAFAEPSGPPAWKNLPSWAVVGTADKAAGSDVVKSMAERARASIVEVDGSHVVMISQPQVVTDQIQKALSAIS
jgi:pimeloyl-ACP methyl ester carboxylesterase